MVLGTDIRKFVVSWKSDDKVKAKAFYGVDGQTCCYSYPKMCTQIPESIRLEMDIDCGSCIYSNTFIHLISTKRNIKIKELNDK